MKPLVRRTRSWDLLWAGAHASPVLPSVLPGVFSHLCSSWGLPPPSTFLPPVVSLLSNVAHTLISQGQAWLGQLRAPPFSKAWAPRTALALLTLLPPPRGALASSKPTLAGGLKCVYFLDLFLNKKQKEQEVQLWRNPGPCTGPRLAAGEVAGEGSWIPGLPSPGPRWSRQDGCVK